MSVDSFETNRVLLFNSFDQDLFQNEPLPEAVSELRDKLLKALSDGRWVLFEFNPDNADDRQKWVSNVHGLCAEQGIQLPLFAALGDRSKIATHMLSIHLSHFQKVAVLMQPYDGDEISLLEALQKFDQEILDADNARESRKARLSRAKI